MHLYKYEGDQALNKLVFRGRQRPRKENTRRERTTTVIKVRTKASVGRSYLSSKSIGEEPSRTYRVARGRKGERREGKGVELGKMKYLFKVCKHFSSSSDPPSPSLG